MHPDQLVCLKCGHREIHRHNKHCPHCPYITMAFERAMQGLDQRTGPAELIFQPSPDEVPGQLSLFGSL